MLKIGEKLRELRIEKDLTMDMLVADLNAKFPELAMNKSMVSRWESNKNEPSLENVKYLSMYYDVSIDYILGLTDVRTPSRLLAYKNRIKHQLEKEQS